MNHSDAKFTSFDNTDPEHTFYGVWNFTSGHQPRALYLTKDQNEKISLALTGDVSKDEFNSFAIIVSGEGAFLNYRITDIEDGVENGCTEEQLVWDNEQMAMAIERILEKLDDEGVVDWITVSIMTSNL